jgi:hypothetical protein
LVFLLPRLQQNYYAKMSLIHLNSRQRYSK